jgi:hypothetical protein
MMHWLFVNHSPPSSPHSTHRYSGPPHHHPSLKRYPPNFHKWPLLSFHVCSRSYRTRFLTNPVYCAINYVGGHGNFVAMPDRSSQCAWTNVSNGSKNGTISSPTTKSTFVVAAPIWMICHTIVNSSDQHRVVTNRWHCLLYNWFSGIVTMLAHSFP